MPRDIAHASTTNGGGDYSTLHEDFESLCNFGGRLLGDQGERRAVAWAFGKLAEIDGQAVRLPLDAPIWNAKPSRLTIAGTDESFECQPMLRTVSTPVEGLAGVVLDLGQGRPEDYENVGDGALGKIVLIEHEYPFSPTHVHRREKLRLAIRHGAKAVLMSNPTGKKGLLSGSSGTLDGFDPIPCGYISEQCALRIRSMDRGAPVVRLFIDGIEDGVSTEIPSVLIGDPSKPRVVMSAHIDGHPLGESALDNATGVAVAIAATRRLAPLFRAGRAYALQTMLFTAEEWALLGSEQYLKGLPEDERRNILLNVNLDTVAGSPNLTALISGFPKLAKLIEEASAESGIRVGTYLPLLANSDHYNFAQFGIPAFRLISGFNEPHSRVQHILSGSDTRDKVEPGELERALDFVCSVLDCATRQPGSFEDLK